MAVDKVWALHDFEAENPDEVSFKAGECIIVVEKDDAYGDGWWQGTNTKGETGLFPFTYTTLDKSAMLQAQSEEGTPDPSGTPQQSSNRPGVMHSTMADIDNALTELQGDRNGTSTNDGFGGSRASFNSERTADMTADDDTSELHAGEDFATRSAAARAALAVNAQKHLDSTNQKEKAEERRMRAQALKEFEEEEARQRELLLQKEKERQAQAAAGTLDYGKEDKPKVAPIAGVDISDESDSEGSMGELDDFGDKTHSPLFGNLASTPKEGTAPRENGSGLKNVVETSEATTPTPAAEESAAPSSDKAAEPATSQNGHTPSGAALTAGVGAVAVGAVAGAAAVTSRSLSPAPHKPEEKPVDQQSLDESSRGAQSITEDSVAGGTGPGTAATSFAGGGPETPKSVGTAFTTAALSPLTSTTGAAKPAGDPTEWSVEQVVDWGRSKGWDETSVLGKFKEHEITGDVLLEMDINILKEIDIVAFGKRFQVANAIKELKKTVPGALQPLPSGLAGRSDGASSPTPQSGVFTPMDTALASPMGAPAGFSGPGSVSGGAPDMQGLNARMAETSFDRGSGSNRSRPNSFVAEGPMSGGQAYSGPGGVAAWQAQQAGQRTRAHTQEVSDEYSRKSDMNEDDTPLAALGDTRQPVGKNRRSTRSNDDTLGALPSSPRKRESAGSAGGSKSGDRTSFFGIGQRNRKPPPKVQSAGSHLGDDERGSKGTFSRLGFARSSRAISTQSGSDIKNNISLPTSSPQYDSNGDTARRNRMSTQSGGTAGQAHGRHPSVGSAGPGANSDWNAATAGVGPGVSSTTSSEGPVMSRIRPVDLEGWMRKKGERYNSWKPRYLALKGSDLVILRDPAAEKIKGYVSMKGYKVIADENTNPGKYGFKILHESEKPHYFSSDDPLLVREWMKGLMKATIGRDHSFPVISSYNNATMSLKEAQRMNPPPRPPSPTSRARTQRAKVRQNPEQLTARDAAILMNLGSGQPANNDSNGL